MNRIRYCTTNSLHFHTNRTNYLDYKFKMAVNDTGYYFCEDDNITLENLKMGSYHNAKKHCQIKTPSICLNQTLQELLSYIFTEAEREKPFFTQFANLNARMWTGATRYNKTHFKDTMRFLGSPSG